MDERPTIAVRLPPLPSELMSGRRMPRTETFEQFHARYHRCLARHGRARYLAVYPRETSWENAIYYRTAHKRGGPHWLRSPPCVLERYRWEKQRWLRLSRDKSLSKGARKEARRMYTGARRPWPNYEASHEAWDAYHAISRSRRADPALYAEWLREQLADHSPQLTAAQREIVFKESAHLYGPKP